jgi:hypothetical protein
VVAERAGGAMKSGTDDTSVLPLDILKNARAKIATPDKWGKGLRRQDRPMATCCAAEAIEESVAAFGPEMRVAMRALHNAAGLDYDRDYRITNWNDEPERTHAEVLAAYDLAIATLGLGATR